MATAVVSRGSTASAPGGPRTSQQRLAEPGGGARVSQIGPAPEAPPVETWNCDMVTMLQPADLRQEELVLLEAARRGDIGQLTRLLASRLDVNARNSLDRTALHWAAANGHTEAIELLLRAGGDPARTDKLGMRPILWGAWFGHVEVIRVLTKRSSVGISATNRQGMGLLHCAAFNNQVDIARFIASSLEGLVDVNAADLSGRTALHLAAEQGFEEMVEALLNMKPSVTAKDARGRSALHCAAQGGHDAICRALLAAGAAACDTDNDGHTGLYLAAEEGHVTTVELLLAANDSAEHTSTRGMTPLMCAAARGHTRVLSRLLQHDSSDLDQQNSDGNTALHLAALSAQIAAAQTLLSHGCSVTVSNLMRQTALHVSIERDNAEIVLMLLEAGAQPSAKDKSGKTALTVAMRSGFSGIVDLIIRAERLTSLTLPLDAETQEDLTATSSHPISSEHNVTSASPRPISREQAATASLPRTDPESNAYDELDLTSRNSNIESNQRSDPRSHADPSRENEPHPDYDISPDYESVSIADDDVSDNVSDDVSDDASTRRSRAVSRTRQAGSVRRDSLDGGPAASVVLRPPVGAGGQRGGAQGGVRREEDSESLASVLRTWAEYERNVRHKPVVAARGGVEEGEIGEAAGAREWELDEGKSEGGLNEGGREGKGAREGSADYSALMRDVLWRLATKQLRAEEWRGLARHWGFTQPQICAISHQYTSARSYREHGYRMLLIWLDCLQQTRPHQHPVAELYSALAATGHGKLAETIRKDCNKSAESRKSCVIS